MQPGECGEQIRDNQNAFEHVSRASTLNYELYFSLSAFVVIRAGKRSAVRGKSKGKGSLEHIPIRSTGAFDSRLLAALVEDRSHFIHMRPVTANDFIQLVAGCQIV